MNRAETLAVMGVLKAAYPTYYRDMSRRDAESVVALWVDMFADEPAPLVAAAVKALIATDEKGFPPHIGAVKARVRQLTQAPEMTDGEAWAVISRALRNSAYDSQREFDALPPRLQRLVGSPSQLREWAMLDAETVQSVIASNFQRAYRARAASDREYDALPADVKRVLKEAAERFALHD